jgi:hypothetical protein
MCTKLHQTDHTCCAGAALLVVTVLRAMCGAGGWRDEVAMAGVVVVGVANPKAVVVECESEGSADNNSRDMAALLLLLYSSS